MTLAELVTILKSTGLPVAYGEFPAPSPPPPFITLQFAYSSDLQADNHNYVEIGNMQVELYTKMKEPETEKLLQDVLKANRFPYSKLETWLETEKLRQIIYEIQLIGG
ncbi:hypothetical protein SAMN02799630_01220 [Paenibacillus sp. UNCCL117]|uniref:hypothetical protein n=1 Tax=unclassified Paenibacillus TaxID=185978 RepID=UPI000890B19B|nr:MULTISPECIES: hypothetical protein [unclassified Paenibacillus]SDC69942.1 hypothetical protein SAMN04488602_103198 [Paenibacillus sp. cl123]SFW24073.1 hypothetical protein SAMN02799630_01220 [Paenibacillus sp. UNCCL117]